MKVLIKATYEWTEEVTDDDLVEICAEHLECDADEDGMDAAFERWQEMKEEVLNEDTGNIADDAKLSVSIVVTK